MERQRITIVISQDVTCEKIMETLEETLQTTHDWAVDRIHTLCDKNCIENAHAIQSEFSEWLNPNILDHDIFSLEFIGEEDDT